MDKILRSLIDDLKTLETKGITIEDNLVRGSIRIFLFDNLGGNKLYNLPQSFNTTFSAEFAQSHQNRQKL